MAEKQKDWKGINPVVQAAIKKPWAKAEQEPEPECQHDWRYNFELHIHECFKCKVPAPPNWNEVDF